MKRMRVTVVSNKVTVFLLLLVGLLVPSDCTTSSFFSNNFLQRKCGSGHNDVGRQQPQTVWAYTGTLTDPLNGHEICTVEGLEVIQPVATTSTAGGGRIADKMDGGHQQRQNSSLSRFRRRCGRNLHIGKAVVSTATSDDKDTPLTGASSACSTYVSRKMFCYTQPNKNSLLTQFRKRVNGPVTKIPIHQAVTVYDSFTSAISSPGSGTTASSNDEDDALLLHTQLSDTSVWAHVKQQQENKNAYQLFARPQARSLSAADLTAMLEQQKASLSSSSSSSSSSTSAATTQPARLSWIQFGASKTHEASKFGARESYLFGDSGSDDNADTGSDASSLLHYSRYGEAPVWYGPSRMCQLQVTGKRCDSSATAERRAPVAAAAARRYVPSFWNVLPTNQQQQQKCDEIDDPVFHYYADALHSALLLDNDDGGGDGPTAAPSGLAKLRSCADYNRFYADLRMGRAVDRLVANPIRLQLTTDDGGNGSNFVKIAARAYDRVCAATSIAIGA